MAAHSENKLRVLVGLSILSILLFIFFALATAEGWIPKM
jgi:hypothetical protein